MKSRLSAAFAAVLGLCAPAAALAQSAEAVFGTWLVENRNAIVRIAPCGEKACGNIVWLAAPLDASGAPKLDFRNEDSALQSRPICGMAMIGDFARGSDGRWSDGFIYNPEEGKTYKSNMHVREDGSLYVRGYVGVSLFGKSQTWTRVADDQGGC